MSNEQGQGLVEYTVMLVLAVIIVLVIIGLMGEGMAVQTPDEALVECLAGCEYYNDRPTLLQRCTLGCYAEYREAVTD